MFHDCDAAVVRAAICNCVHRPAGSQSGAWCSACVTVTGESGTGPDGVHTSARFPGLLVGAACRRRPGNGERDVMMVERAHHIFSQTCESCRLFLGTGQILTFDRKYSTDSAHLSVSPFAQVEMTTGDQHRPSRTKSAQDSSAAQLPARH